MKTIPIEWVFQLQIICDLEYKFMECKMEYMECKLNKRCANANLAVKIRDHTIPQVNTI